jgi:hypothetical protein
MWKQILTGKKHSQMSRGNPRNVLSITGNLGKLKLI